MIENRFDQICNKHIFLIEKFRDNPDSISLVNISKIRSSYKLIMSST